MDGWFSEITERWRGRAALLLPGGEAVSYDALRRAALETPLPDEGTIATWMPETEGHLMILAAALARGRPFCAISPRLPRGPAAELARRAGARVLLTPDGGVSVEAAPRPALRPGDTVVFSSGSSGEPKAVVLPLESHLASARGAAPLLGLEPGDAWALSLPLHHVSGLAVVFRCWDSGAAVDLSGEPGRATHLSLVATQLKRRLAARQSWRGLKAVLLGGGPAGLDLVNQAVAAGCPLHLTYGMTETSSQLTTTPRLNAPLSHVHAGRPLPGRRVEITAGGRILAGGAVLARGILGSDGVVRPLPLSDEGLYQTGDTGHWDAAGNLVVTGRLDRMFISGGENIHPEMIERALLACDAVEAAVVVARDDPEWGKRPVAFVRSQTSPERLEDLLAQSLPRFMIPVAFYPWPEDLPAPEGKIPAGVLKRLHESLCGAQESR